MTAGGKPENYGGVLIATSRHFDRDCRILTQARRERVIQHVIVFANVLRDRLRRQTANPTELIQTSGMSQQALTQLTNKITRRNIRLALFNGNYYKRLKKGKFQILFMLK